MKQVMNFGFSLIEIMIVLGIISLLAVGFVTMMGNIQKEEEGLSASLMRFMTRLDDIRKEEKELARSTEYIILKNSILLSLQRGDLCLKGLQGIRYNPQIQEEHSIEEISFGSMNLKTGGTIGVKGPKISSMILKKTDDVPFFNLEKKTIAYFVDFIISAKATGDTDVLYTYEANPIKLYLTLDTQTNEAISCFYCYSLAKGIFNCS